MALKWFWHMDPVFLDQPQQGPSLAERLKVHKAVKAKIREVSQEMFIQNCLRARKRMQKFKVSMTLGDTGRPIVANLSSLHTTCPTCAMIHTIDIADERSARMDVESFEKHMESCAAQAKVE